jgi:hypothetical protein
MVRKERLELSHLAAPEPKSGASTNSATSAYCLIRINSIECSLELIVQIEELVKLNLYICDKSQSQSINGAEGET